MPTMPRGDSKDMAWAAVRTALQQSGLHEGEVAETHVRMLVDALTRDIAAHISRCTSGSRRHFGGVWIGTDQEPSPVWVCFEKRWNRSSDTRSAWDLKPRGCRANGRSSLYADPAIRRRAAREKNRDTA